MDDFFYFKNNKNLYCEEIVVDAIIEKYGTPLYIYSKNSILSRYNEIKNAFKDFPNLICFSVKSNSNISVLKFLAQAGAGMDIISGGELFRVMKAGVDCNKIIYSGPGKTEEEIRKAIESNILMFNVESLPELYLIDKIAGMSCKKAPISFRINPDIDAQTHKHTTTGTKENKFGVPFYYARNYYKEASKAQNIEIKGIDVHLGSPIHSFEPYIKAIEKLKILVEELRMEKIDVSVLDIGGGYGVEYKEEKPFDISDFAKQIIPVINNMGIEKLVLEPGRYIVCKGGIFVVKVIYVKDTGHKKFVITDGGMNDLIRPAFYDAYHQIMPLHMEEDKKMIADIVGPICESSDYFAKSRQIPCVKENDYLAIFNAGAYCFSMSSNYNSRPRAPEVLINGSLINEIRKRENYEDLIRGEIV